MCSRTTTAAFVFIIIPPGPSSSPGDHASVLSLPWSTVSSPAHHTPPLCRLSRRNIFRLVHLHRDYRPQERKKKKIPRIFSHLLESQAPLKTDPCTERKHPLRPPPSPPSPPSQLVEITSVIGAQKQNKLYKKRNRKAIVYIIGCSATCLVWRGVPSTLPRLPALAEPWRTRRRRAPSGRASPPSPRPNDASEFSFYRRYIHEARGTYERGREKKTRQKQLVLPQEKTEG